MTSLMQLNFLFHISVLLSLIVLCSVVLMYTQFAVFAVFIAAFLMCLSIFVCIFNPRLNLMICRARLNRMSSLISTTRFVLMQ